MTLENLDDTIINLLVIYHNSLKTQTNAASIMKILAEDGHINQAIAYIDITEKEMEAALAMLKSVKYAAIKRREYA